MPLNILPTDKVSRLKWIRAGKIMLTLRVANEGSTIKEKDFQYIFNRYAIWIISRIRMKRTFHGTAWD